MMNRKARKETIKNMISAGIKALNDAREVERTADDITARLQQQQLNTYKAYRNSTLVERIMYWAIVTNTSYIPTEIEYELIDGTHYVSFKKNIIEAAPAGDVLIAVTERDITISITQQIGNAITKWDAEIEEDINTGRKHIKISADNAISYATPIEIKRFMHESVHDIFGYVKMSDFDIRNFIAVRMIMMDTPQRNIHNVAAKMLDEKKKQEEAQKKQEDVIKMETQKKQEEIIRIEAQKNCVSKSMFNEVITEMNKYRSELEAAKTKIEELENQLATSTARDPRAPKKRSKKS